MTPAEAVTQTTRRLIQRARTRAAHAFLAIDNWTPEQCQDFMTWANGESRKVAGEIAGNLEYYREHCRYIFRDHYNITDEEIANAIGRS